MGAASGPSLSFVTCGFEVIVGMQGCERRAIYVSHGSLLRAEGVEEAQRELDQPFFGAALVRCRAPPISS
jgi:hypothetical protein